MIGMNLRAPAIPLITIDPYFSVWSATDELNASNTVHWTCKPNRITGILAVDNVEYLFMGTRENTEKMVQTGCDINTFSTVYTFKCEQANLKLTFTSPLLPNDLKIMSRPVSYMHAEVSTPENFTGRIELRLYVHDDICLDHPGESPTTGEHVNLDNAVCARMGNSIQNVLSKAGDDVRINWGYFYLAVNRKDAEILVHSENGSTILEARIPMGTVRNPDTLVLFAYDDIYSIQYYGKNLKGYWTLESESVETIIRRAIAEYAAGQQGFIYKVRLACMVRIINAGKK